MHAPLRTDEALVAKVTEAIYGAPIPEDAPNLRTWHRAQAQRALDAVERHVFERLDAEADSLAASIIDSLRDSKGEYEAAVTEVLDLVAPAPRLAVAPHLRGRRSSEVAE